MMQKHARSKGVSWKMIKTPPAHLLRASFCNELGYRHFRGFMTDRKFITEGEGLPQWSNPISHAVVVNDTCYISGQLSVNTEGQYVEGNIEDEANRAFSNIFAAAKAAGFRKEEIVYIDIAFSDLSELPAVNELYMELFPEGRRPARTIYEAATLPFGGKIKVVATAVKDR